MEKIKKYLFDINESINSIDEYLCNKRDFDNYTRDKQLRRAIEREFEIIGKAANRILQIDSSIEFENARKIVDFRNLIIHSYDKIDDKIIWNIISEYLPNLKIEVEKLLNINH